MATDFAPGPAPTATTPLFAGAALLDAEKLDCYRLAVAFQALTGRLLPKRSGVSGLRDQLDRASVSIVLNIAEAMVAHCLRLSDVMRREGIGRGKWLRRR